MAERRIVRDLLATSTERNPRHIYYSRLEEDHHYALVGPECDDESGEDDGGEENRVDGGKGP